MRIFKNNFTTVIGTFIWISLPYFVIFYLILRFFNFDIFIKITVYHFIMLVFYIAICYLYYGFTSNDIIVTDNQLIVYNGNRFNKKFVIYDFNEIETVVFRHEWTVGLDIKHIPKFITNLLRKYLLQHFFPTDYKWIKINNKKYYCFGLEMDFYDNYSDQNRFELLYDLLIKNGISACWTPVDDIFYNQMNKYVDK